MSEQTNTPNETANTEDMLVTGYRAAAIVNLLLKEEGLTDNNGDTKEIKPQMLYQYIKKGTLPSVEQDGKKYVRMGDLAAWYEKFRDGTIARGGGVALSEQVDEFKALLNR